MYHASDKADGCASWRGAGFVRHLLWKTMTEAVYMRVVVVKSPKMLGGILRKIFGIQKMPKEL